MTEKTTNQINPQRLEDFCARVMVKIGVSSNDAKIIAESLVAADLRGISTHGVARLRYYIDEIRAGIAKPSANIQIVRETPSTALLDGGGGMGQPVSTRAMQIALDKAKNNSVGFVTVRNSNHYGTAGYYAMMALEHDMIGISMTNAFVLVAPTFGRQAMLGTNPISVAVPAGKEYPYVLDMSTSAVTFGKLENYERFEQPLPEGWAIDESGKSAVDAGRTVHMLDTLAGGGMLPLGGISELLGGHKGYGLALLVDILSGVLSGGGYADNIYPVDENGQSLPSNVGHFFGAMRNR